MAAPVPLSATWNSTAHVLTVTWDQSVTYVGEGFDDVFLTDASGATWKNPSAPALTGAIMAFVLTAQAFSVGPAGTAEISADTASAGGLHNADTLGFAVTAFGGSVPTAGIPTIGTYDEYTNVYSANSSQIATGATQAQIQGFLDVANLTAARFCGIAFTNAGNTQQTFTEIVNGDGSDTIRIRNTPIVAVTSITVTSPDGSTDTIDSTTYACELATGTIRRRVPGNVAYVFDVTAEFAPVVTVGSANYFPEGFQNITVVYTGAYTTAPADLRWAVYETVDEALARVGIRGTKGVADAEEMRASLIRRLRPFERIVC